MKRINYTGGRDQLARTMDQVCDVHEPIIITRQRQRSVVMLSLEDYESLTETANLLKSRVNARRLLAATQQSEAGRGRRRKVNLEA